MSVDAMVSVAKVSVDAKVSADCKRDYSGALSEEGVRSRCALRDSNDVGSRGRHTIRER